MTIVDANNILDPLNFDTVNHTTLLDTLQLCVCIEGTENDPCFNLFPPRNSFFFFCSCSTSVGLEWSSQVFCRNTKQR